MGQEKEAAESVSAPSPVAFSWDHERGSLKPVSAPASMDAGGGMLESPRKAVATQGMAKSAVKPESARKAQAPTRRLSVPPPPGRPAARGFSRAVPVRPEDDPFLAAYLACTKQSTGGDGGKNRTSGGREAKKGKTTRRFAWSVLGLGGLSCKRDAGVVARSMVRLPELDPMDNASLISTTT